MTGLISSVQAWPWGPIITTIVGSGVISALANNGLQWWRSSADRKAAGRQTARRAVGDLERYAREMADAAQKWAAVDLHEQHSYGPDWPDVPLVETRDWTGFPTLLVDKIHKFNADHDVGRHSVRSAFEADDELGVSRAADFSLEIGLSAWSLASDLRAHAGFPPGSSRINDYYDFVDWMQSEQRRHEDAYARDVKAREEMSRRQAAAINDEKPAAPKDGGPDSGD